MKVGSLDESSIAAFTALAFAAGAAGSFLLRRVVQRLLEIRRPKISDVPATMSGKGFASGEASKLNEKRAKLERLIVEADDRIAALQGMLRQSQLPAPPSTEGNRPTPTSFSRRKRQPIRPLVVRLDEESESDVAASDASLQESVSRFAAWRKRGS